MHIRGNCDCNSELKFYAFLCFIRYFAEKLINLNKNISSACNMNFRIPELK